ncbi:MAG TPA: archease [Ignavibacteriales bacterium]|nr:archease [Ignavibacteriales bacterium]
MKSYRFIEHTADIAVEVRGGRLEDLFSNSAEAWLETVLGSDFIPYINDVKDVTLRELSSEELLVGFLSELNYLLFVHRWIPARVSGLTIEKKGEEFLLIARLEGEEFSLERHSLKEEIKAVTFHNMNIVKQRGEFVTRIVFDI